MGRAGLPPAWLPAVAMSDSYSEENKMGDVISLSHGEGERCAGRTLMLLLFLHAGNDFLTRSATPFAFGYIIRRLRRHRTCKRRRICLLSVSLLDRGMG